MILGLSSDSSFSGRAAADDGSCDATSCNAAVARSREKITLSGLFILIFIRLTPTFHLQNDSPRASLGRDQLLQSLSITALHKTSQNHPKPSRRTLDPQDRSTISPISSA
ncbi:uncharacterized protein V6R79_015321 [Siganus canaliculatus]